MIKVSCPCCGYLVVAAKRGHSRLLCLLQGRIIEILHLDFSRTRRLNNTFWNSYVTLNNSNLKSEIKSLKI